VLMQIARAGVGDWSAGPGGVLMGRARAVVEVDRALGRLCLSRPRPQGRFAGDVVPPVGRWWPARWTVPLCELEYQSVWCCIAAHLSQVGGGVLEGSATGGRCCLLRDPGGDSVAVLVRNGAIHHAGARGKVLASWLNAEVERWEAFGRPPLSRWRVRFGQVGSPGSGLLVPVQWRLRGILARASSSARAEVGAFG
jgi:hypothetical protein